MMNNIYIFSGKVQSGKSARLLEWSKRTPSCAGILTPSINGKKYIVDISDGEKKALQISGEMKNSDVIKVGRYFFSQEAFEWSKKRLLRACKNDPQWLVIDEIGYLELKGGGFEPAVTQILPEIENNLLLVIRDKLVRRVIEHFKLENYGNLIISGKLPDEQ